MKRLCVFLAAFLLFMLVGCSSKYMKSDISVFTEWLDSEGFVSGMSQLKMFQKMDGYTYNGCSINDSLAGMFQDGKYGGGYTANGKNFGFRNYYQESKDRKTANYINSFYTRVPLDELTLPFGVDFEDTLQDVLTKLGIKVKLPSTFTADKGTDVEMTLYKDKRCTLVFKNLYLSEEPGEVDYPYELIFTESDTFTRENSSKSTVTRTITFTFSSKEDMLNKFCVTVQEDYELE